MEKRVKKVFENWLNACMNGSIGDHLLELADKPPVQMPEEEIQLSWFDNQDWETVRAYKGRWYKSASLRLIKEAPEEVVKFYVFYCSPIDEQKQLALIERDIACRSHLAMEYFPYYHACDKVRELIHKQAQKGDDYFIHLWHRVLMVYYGWEWKFEKRFNTLAVWQAKLKSHYEELTVCRYDELEEILDAIE